MQERALGLARSELERTGVGGSRLLVPAEPVQELPAGRVPEVVAIEPGQPIDDLESAVEELVHLELSSKPQVSQADLRRLVSVLLIVPELERSGDLVEHIALRTQQGMGGRISARARGLVQQMGDVGVEMWRAAADAYADRDAYAADRLRLLDDRLDDLHVTLSVELAQSLTSAPVAIEMGLVARFLERLGDHAVNVARRLRDMCPPAEGRE